MKKKTTKLLSLLLASTFLCSLFTGCNQSADEELIARNNVFAVDKPWITSDETGGIYLNQQHILCYIDPQNAIGTPVCGKPDCVHDKEDYNSECFAVRVGNITNCNIYYYQNYLYYTNGGILYQSDSVGTNEKQLAYFGQLMEKRIEAAMDADPRIRGGKNATDIVGIHDGKLYVLAVTGLEYQLAPAFVVSGKYAFIKALFTCDLKTGAVERCQDETLRAMVEDVPISNSMAVTMCGDILFVAHSTTTQELLPVPDGFLEDEDWTEKWINGDFVKETKGDTIYQAYSLAEKKVLKEWSVPDTEETRQLLMIQINADRTFLHVEQADGKYRYTEYNQNCEKTAEFTLEQDAKVIKHGEYYYYKFLNQNETDFYRYNLKTKQTDTLKTDGAIGFLSIVGDVIFGTSGEKGYEYALMDLSCFDTGKAVIRQVGGVASTAVSED